MPPDNAVRKLINSRITVLIENARSASALIHGPTVGQLREAYLRDFAASLIPHQLAITSGFLADPLGALSPQLDFIVYDPMRLPRIVLQPDLAVVPIDSALLVAEIKSDLTTDVFEQLQRQRESINAMAHSAQPIVGAHLKVLHAVLAYENSVAVETLKKWFQQQADLMSVCVLNEWSIDRLKPAQLQQVTPTPDNPYGHVLTFVSRLYNGLLEVARMREKLTPRFEEYLFPEEPTSAQPVAG